MTLASGQAMAGIGDVVSLLEVRVNNLDDAGKIADELLQRAGGGFTVSTWMDENRALFKALSLEKLVTAIFIGLITFVAGLNILVVLSMTVTDRARDIAVLMAMGARRKQVRKIFVLQGLAVSFVGTFAGLVLGYTLAWVADRWRLIPLNPEVYAIPYVPFRANGFDALWIAAAALAISIAATMLPARSAARILPVEILGSSRRGLGSVVVLRTSKEPAPRYELKWCLTGRVRRGVVWCSRYFQECGAEVSQLRPRRGKVRVVAT